MKIKLLILLLIFPLLLLSQEDRIDAQRPTLAESFSLIKGNTLQFENGLQYDIKTSSLIGNTFIRHSFFNLIELRMLKTFNSDNISYSGKFLLSKGDNFLGLGVSFIYTNNGNDEYKVILTKDFNRLSLTLNNAWDDELNSGMYSNINLSYLMYPNWSSFLEVQFNGNNDTTYQSGVVFIPHDNFQFDTFIGYNNLTNFYMGLGISFRIYYGKKKTYIIKELY